MFKLDDNLLRELGLGALPAEEKNKMLSHIYETLEMRVGMKLAEQMTDAQLDEFEEFINRNDEAGALKWLETNFPDYKQVVADELEKLKAEIKEQAPHIVAASEASQDQPAQGQVQTTPSPAEAASEQTQDVPNIASQPPQEDVAELPSQPAAQTPEHQPLPPVQVQELPNDQDLPRTA